MNIFTLVGSKVTKGTEIEEYKLKGIDKVIDVIEVGEEGGGHIRKIGRLSVYNAEIKEVDGKKMVFSGSLGETLSKRPRLEKDSGKDKDKVLLVFRTQIGYRGSSEHWKEVNEEREKIDNVIAYGVIAQGAAGRMGSGYQYILVAEIGDIFGTRVTGQRMNDLVIYYKVVGKDEVIPLTEEERKMVDIF